ncbi:restriction endonuclease subunit S [Tenacibaculum finnmarkense]|uniref:restriction endonuclease subunit S n=1 Tax=Tenacibaculum finnmarkense TaxID=2781243 RepID=UPI001EFA38A6|nr:restriction endonuclease subunit S [Tenacibaculum finnmarkense]MCG8238291.1 restriction endonuclease subunit S [Tenacibaculum finnmarkense genomovar ulcerans]
MKSNYRKIGDFIQLVDERNKDLKVTKLLGLSISKQFIPSVANTIGTNMKNYKIIRKNQFACSTMQVRRDKKMPIALLQNFEEAIISQAYPVFKIIDETILNSEYLMMWFSRSEFDRHACFLAIGGVRGSLEWEDFLEMPIPVPSIEKQHEIVKEYNTVANRITLNETINKKLEDTAQALYKHWFVDFEFPNEQGKPYKSNGGKMVYNEELDLEIPLGWEVGNIEALCNIIDGDRGKNYPNQQDFLDSGHCLFLNAGNVSKTGFDFNNKSFISKEKDELLRKGKLNRNDIVLTSRGTVGNIGFYSDLIEFEHLRINSGMVIFRAKVVDYSIFIYSLMRNEQMSRNIENFISGSAQPQLPIKDIKLIPVLIPNFNLILSFSKSIISIQNHLEIINKENRKLNTLQNLLLSKMSKVAIEKEMVC